MIQITQPSPSRVSRRTFLHGAAALLAGCFLEACSRNPARPVFQGSETPVPGTPASQASASPGGEGMDLEIQVLLRDLDFPEGPAFDPEGSLWCTELGSGNLVRLKDGKPERIPTRGRPNGLAFDHRGRAWICDSGQNAIRRFDPGTGQWETLLDEVGGKPLQSPNDLAFDRQGNLIFTCPNYANNQPTGYVGCLRPNGTAVKIVEGFYRPNGLDLADDGAALVVADTYRKMLFKGAWNAETCAWDDPAPWAQVGGSEGPDGMLPGGDGLLYAAVFGDGVIRVVDANGQVVNSYALPGANPTNVACDPAGKLGLVVTEAEQGLLLSLPGVNPGAAIFDGGEAWP
jgi:gluconolactonase